MIVLDFLIGNEDRHFNNFGLIRNAVTLEWIGVAPIFDCGTSLWYNTQESLIKPLSPNLPAKPLKKTHREQTGWHERRNGRNSIPVTLHHQRT